MYDTSPTLFIPDANNGDDGIALRALIEDGRRWIQIAGPRLRLSTTVPLMSGTQPAHFIFIEPAPGIARVVVDVDGIGRNPSVPTDPSYSGFEYSGLHRPGASLAVAAAVDDQAIVVTDGATFAVGDWIYLSDESRNPAYLLPIDGPMESRRIVAKQESVLTLDRPLKRDHYVGIAVALHTPILSPRFERLDFTGNAAGGIHLHSAHDARIAQIGSFDWRGRFLVLLDNGGLRNVVDGVFCNGSEPGIAATQNAWGVAMEGQEDSRSYRSGGTGCGNGHIINYCVDTVAQDVVAYANNVNDNINWKSIRCTSLMPRTAFAAVAETIVSADCVDSDIIGRIDYSTIPSNATNLGDLRTLPIGEFFEGDYVLAIGGDGGGKQVPKDRLVILRSDGSYASESLEVRSAGTIGGSFRSSNAGASWLMGMLSVPGARDWQLFDLTNGSTRMSVSAASGEVDVPGSLVVHGNLAMEASSGIFMGGRKVLGVSRPATANLNASATLSDVIAKINLILADERAHGLRQS